MKQGCKRLNKVGRTVEQALRETGLPYEIVNGGAHKKVFICGRFVGIFSNNGHTRHDGANTIRAIRQFQP